MTYSYPLPEPSSASATLSPDDQRARRSLQEVLLKALYSRTADGLEPCLRSNPKTDTSTYGHDNLTIRFRSGPGVCLDPTDETRSAWKESNETESSSPLALAQQYFIEKLSAPSSLIIESLSIFELQRSIEEEQKEADPEISALLGEFLNTIGKDTPSRSRF